MLVYVCTVPFLFLTSGVLGMTWLSHYKMDYGFAAVNSAGTVTSWGNTDYNYDDAFPEGILTDVVSISSTSTAFAALRSDGTVAAWGASANGGAVPASDPNAVPDPATRVTNGLVNVISISSTQYAFAAIKSDGTVVSWGLAGNGGPGAMNAHAGQPSGLTGVIAVYGNAHCFLALKEDRTAEVWGHSDYGGEYTGPEGGLSDIAVVSGMCCVCLVYIL